MPIIELDSTIKAIDTINQNIQTTYILTQKSQNDGIPISSIVSAVVTIVMFFLGLLVSFIIRKWQLRTTMINQERYIVFWVDKAESNVKSQIQVLKDLSTKIESPKAGSIQYGVGNMHIDKLKVFNPIELVRMFVTNKNDNNKQQDNLYNFTYNIDLLDRLYTEGITTFEVFKDLSKRNNEDWLHMTTNLDEWFNKVYALGEKRIKENEFYKEIYIIRGAFFENHKIATQKDSYNEHDFINDNLILPLYNICQEKILSHGENVEALLSILHKIAKVYVRRKSHNKQMADAFMQIGNNMNKAYENVKAAKDESTKASFKLFLLLI